MVLLYQLGLFSLVNALVYVDKVIKILNQANIYPFCHYQILCTYRWNKCVSGASSEYKGFGYAVGHKYILEYFDEESKDTVGHLVENLISAFKELVGESVWMDVETQVS